MAVSQTVGVEAKLLQLVEHEGMIGLFIKQWAEVVKLSGARGS